MTYETENCRLGNTNPTNILGWIQVLRTGKPVLLVREDMDVNKNKRLSNTIPRRSAVIVVLCFTFTEGHTYS